MLSSYLRYVVKRKNEYHIHSPFVYALYTKVIRGGHPEALKALGIERIEPLKEDEPIQKDETVMYELSGIHKDKQKEALWNTICGRPDVTLTIDLYDRGLAFYREGMEKQNYILRR